MSPKEILAGSAEEWRIKKNVAVVTVAFMVLFTAVNGAVNLQSSINAEAGLGTGSLVAAFAGALVSNIFLTSVIIKYLGTKWTICCSFIAHMPFIAFQMYPRFGTLVPFGLLMGLSAGTLLCAKSTYISVLAEALSRLTKIPSSTILLNFSGFFFMIVHMGQIWGNLISSLVLSVANNASMTLVNETMIPQLCGSNFLSQADATEALPAQPPEKILMLTGIYLACMVGATIFVAVGLDSMKRYESCRKTAESEDSLTGFTLLVVTLRQLANSNQQLLLAINIFMGLQQAFFFADFTASFVSCTIGTGSVGFVMMTYGISNVSGCCITAYLAKLFGRLPLICSALVIHGGVLVTMLLWHPHSQDLTIILTIAVLWGVCDSIWIIQINTYYGVLFRGKEEAAYSNLGLWEGVGYIISFVLSSCLRTRYKVYLLLCNLIVGVLGYLIVEYRQHRERRHIEKLDWAEDNSSISEQERRAELEKLTYITNYS